MSVTQQMVQVSSSELGDCKAGKEILSKLLYYKLPRERYVDFDWATGYLSVYFEKTQNPELVKLFRQAIDGNSKIEYPDDPKLAPIYSELGCLDVEEVREIARRLEEIDKQDLFASLPEDIQAAQEAFKLEFLQTVHPRDYLVPYFERLCLFYKVASSKQMAIIMWWD